MFGNNSTLTHFRTGRKLSVNCSRLVQSQLLLKQKNRKKRNKLNLRNHQFIAAAAAEAEPGICQLMNFFAVKVSLDLGYQSSKQVYYVLNYLFNGVVCIVFKALHKQFLLKLSHYRPYLTKLGKSVDLD